EELKSRYGVLNGIVHSVAFAPAEELKGEFVNTTREGFRIAHDISVYSLIAVSRAAAPLMTAGGGIVTLTYYGAEKVVPKYNVMGVAKAALEATVRYLANDLGPRGIRVNAISAGPIKTLAARGISNLGDMLKAHAERAPLKRNVDPGEVGGTATFLLSEAGSGITGETIFVDCGYNIMGFCVAQAVKPVHDLRVTQSRIAQPRVAVLLKMSKLTIAIDGPAGSGKSSVARCVAAMLAYLYLDSGAMYRALGLKALRQGILLDDEARLAALANQTHIELRAPTAEHEAAGAKNCVFLDGADVTREIRTSEVAQAASRLATIAEV